MINASNQPFVERLLPTDNALATTLRNVVLVAFGTFLLFVSAKTQVPFWPVPMTMQTLVVILIGATYGSQLGFATLLAYLGEGLIGLPVFASTPQHGVGLAYMSGPTGGYLIGFLFAATLVGWLVERWGARSLALTAVSVFAGHAIIHTFGLAWLTGLIGFKQAVTAAFVPFVPADMLKMAISTAIILALRPANLRD